MKYLLTFPAIYWYSNRTSLSSLWLKEVFILKATEIVRKVDELGRIVIPIELRRTMGINLKDDMEIYVDTDNIILKKFEPTCLFWGNTENLRHTDNRIVCTDCINRLVKE